MKMPDALLRLMFRPRVVHSLPGRLRVQLLNPKILRNVRSEVVDLVIELMRVPDEINEVQGNPITGKVLIHYDPDQATENDVLTFLNALFEIYLVNRQLLDDLPAERWPAVREKLVTLVRGAIRHRLTLNPQLEITADALA
jgi:hypothetical protein